MEMLCYSLIKHPSLSSLAFKHCSLNDSITKPLLSMLARNQILEYLDLRDNNLTDTFGLSLCSLLESSSSSSVSSLRTCLLSLNPISYRILNQLDELLKLKKKQNHQYQIDLLKHKITSLSSSSAKLHIIREETLAKQKEIENGSNFIKQQELNIESELESIQSDCIDLLNEIQSTQLQRSSFKQTSKDDYSALSVSLQQQRILLKEQTKVQASALQTEKQSTKRLTKALNQALLLWNSRSSLELRESSFLAESIAQQTTVKLEAELSTLKTKAIALAMNLSYLVGDVIADYHLAMKVYLLQHQQQQQQIPSSSLSHDQSDRNSVSNDNSDKHAFSSTSSVAFLSTVPPSSFSATSSLPPASILAPAPSPLACYFPPDVNNYYSIEYDANLSLSSFIPWCFGSAYHSATVLSILPSATAKRMPILAFAQALLYLHHYPHSCSEQQLSLMKEEVKLLFLSSSSSDSSAAPLVPSDLTKERNLFFSVRLCDISSAVPQQLQQDIGMVLATTSENSKAFSSSTEVTFPSNSSGASEEESSPGRLKLSIVTDTNIHPSIKEDKVSTLSFPSASPYWFDLMWPGSTLLIGKSILRPLRNKEYAQTQISSPPPPNSTDTLSVEQTSAKATARQKRGRSNTMLVTSSLPVSLVTSDSVVVASPKPLQSPRFTVTITSPNSSANPMPSLLAVATSSSASSTLSLVSSSCASFLSHQDLKEFILAHIRHPPALPSPISSSSSSSSSPSLSSTVSPISSVSHSPSSSTTTSSSPPSSPSSKALQFATFTSSTASSPTASGSPAHRAHRHLMPNVSSSSTSTIHVDTHCLMICSHLLPQGALSRIQELEPSCSADCSVYLIPSLHLPPPFDKWLEGLKEEPKIYTIEDQLQQLSNASSTTNSTPGTSQRPPLKSRKSRQRRLSFSDDHDEHEHDRELREEQESGRITDDDADVDMTDELKQMIEQERKRIPITIVSATDIPSATSSTGTSQQASAINSAIHSVASSRPLTARPATSDSEKSVLSSSSILAEDAIIATKQSSPSLSARSSVTTVITNKQDSVGMREKDHTKGNAKLKESKRRKKQPTRKDQDKKKSRSASIDATPASESIAPLFSITSISGSKRSGSSKAGVSRASGRESVRSSISFVRNDARQTVSVMQAIHPRQVSPVQVNRVTKSIYLKALPNRPTSSGSVGSVSNSARLESFDSGEDSGRLSRCSVSSASQSLAAPSSRERSRSRNRSISQHARRSSAVIDTESQEVLTEEFLFREVEPEILFPIEDLSWIFTPSDVVTDSIGWGDQSLLVEYHYLDLSEEKSVKDHSKTIAERTYTEEAPTAIPFALAALLRFHEKEKEKAASKESKQQQNVAKAREIEVEQYKEKQKEKEQLKCFYLDELLRYVKPWHLLCQYE